MNVISISFTLFDIIGIGNMIIKKIVLEHIRIRFSNNFFCFFYLLSFDD